MLRTRSDKSPAAGQDRTAGSHALKKGELTLADGQEVLGLRGSIHRDFPQCFHAPSTATAATHSKAGTPVMPLAQAGLPQAQRSRTGVGRGRQGCPQMHLLEKGSRGLSCASVPWCPELSG